MSDPFDEIARFYDRIMDHVNYDRWFTVTTSLAELLPVDFVHLEAACGTGTLLKMLRKIGWKSLGVDLSLGMARSTRLNPVRPPVAVADLRALPFADSLDYVTCLFDSMNFILEEQHLSRTFESIATALRPGGILYFDVVTERMVTEHFKDQEWTEDNGGFSTTWRSTYDAQSGITETDVHVTSGAGGTFRERIYPLPTIQALIKQTDLTLLAALDAHTWRSPSKRSIRVDFVAAKQPGANVKKMFANVQKKIRSRLY